MNTPNTIRERVEYLRAEIVAERISYAELAELQSLAEHIEPGDTLLMEWAGMSEYPQEVVQELTQQVLARNGSSDLRGCSECGCTDTEEPAWIHCNTGKVCDGAPPFDYAYCPQCELTFGNGETSLLYVSELKPFVPLS